MKKLLAFLAAVWSLLATPIDAQTIPAGAWGSINYWGVGGLSQVLAPGLAGQCLTSQNVGSAPVWVNCQVSSLSLLPPINANSIMANNTLNFVPPQAIDVNRVLDMVGYDIIRPPLPESIIYKSNVGPNFNWQTLPPGTSGSLLTSGGPTNPPFWAPNTIQANLSGVCTTVGAVLYFDTPSNLWACLNPGTAGQLLQTAGAGANPSWLTVTLATLGGVPSTRNINTSGPLGGGGALATDLTLTCTTCVTSSGGGAATGTAPITVSAAAVVACATCATTTNGGALSATAPIAISAAGVISITSPLPIANGGTNGTTQQAAFDNLAPTATRAGDITYWNGTHYVNLAGNNSGTNVLTENASGVPSWSAPGTGTVTSITPGAGVVSSVTAACSQTAVTTTGTISGAECVNAQSGTSYTVVDGDRAKFIIGTNASNMSYTLPQAGAGSAFVSGWYADIRNNGSGGAVLTITPTTSTVDGAATVTISQGASLRIVSDGTNYFTKRGLAFIAGFNNSLGADVLLNNTGNYFDGPSTAQGTVGTWFASGTVTLIDTAATAGINCKLWDGTTVIASARTAVPIVNVNTTIALSGFITNPAANIKISCNDSSATTGKIIFNASGNSKDSTLTALRTQ